MIRVSYKASYKGFDCLLMTADRTDALALATFLRQWAIELRHLSLSQVPLFQFTDEIEVEMDGSREQKSGMMRKGPAGYAWLLDQEEAASFADLAEGLASAGIPGHAYLETNDGDVSVVLSLGESS